MMFGNEDDVLDAGGLGGPHPLFGVHIRRIEHRRIGGAVSPLPIHKRVRTEMDDRAYLQILPSDLLWVGFHIGEVLC